MSGDLKLEKLLERRKEAAEKREAARLARRKPRGGKRANAGRKPNYAARTSLDPVNAHLLLNHFNSELIQIVGELLHSKSHDVRLRTFQYLMDRAYGKPLERGELAATGIGGINVNFVNVPDDQLQTKIDELAKDLGYEERPALPAPQVLTEPLPAPASEPTPAPWSAGGLSPEPEVLLPHPPRHVVNGAPGVRCLKHGVYWPTPKITTCPACIADGEEDARRQASYLPGGMGN